MTTENKNQTCQLWDANKPTGTRQNTDKILGDKLNLWGLEIHWRVLWDKLKKQMTNLKTYLRRDK